MSPEAQRIAIAEACGWKEISVNTYQRPHLWLGDKPAFGDDGKILSYTVDQRVPDYPNDLNAMHEAEKELFWTDGDMARRIYSGHLLAITNDKVGKAFDPSRLDWWHSQCATAAQRAEAFLRTIGKWEAQPNTGTPGEGAKSL